MNKTAEIVNLWAEFEENHTTAGIDDFCRYYLNKKKNEADRDLAEGINQPYADHSRLAKLVGRLMRLNSYYANLALKEIGIGGLDEFTYLLTVRQLNEPRKTDVIYKNFHDLSSGLLIIDRLKNKKLLTEKADEKDKRSRLLKLTVEGELKLNEAQVQLDKVSDMFYTRLPADDIKLCIQLLSPIELVFSGLWREHKGHTFDEIHKNLTEDKSVL
jgi:DNA-binding MarR family transcriptional regulator